MLHAEDKPRCLERQDTSAIEPCSKKMKSTEEPYGKSYDGLQSLYEEIHIKKTHSGFIPLSLSDEEDEVNETVPSKEVFLDIKPVTRKPSYSVNNAEFTGNKDTFCINNAVLVNNRENKSFEEYKNEGDTELYSTSKAFIGPIYKSTAVRQHEEKKNYSNRNNLKVLKAALGGSSKKETASKRSLPCDIPKIEDELSQFYSEIHQLENDEDDLDGAERDSDKKPVEYNKWNQIEGINLQDWSYSKTTSNCDANQGFYTEPSDNRICSEQNPYDGQMGHRTSNGQYSDNGRNVWDVEKVCNKQAGSRFWNDSVPPFMPSWQQMHPFIIPYGPPPPQFIPNFNFQEPISSLHHSNNFCSSNVGPFKNTHINMTSLPPDKNNESANHSGAHSIYTIQNGCSAREGYIGNGFCETGARLKDAQQAEGLSSVSQQFLDGNLCGSQKALLMLRGLPGSGKTTLSRILLGQSRNGIVFSTDDYFCQQDGYWSYNVGQLGAAHDWNQKRAKQAMDQGRSPIIIDNTNTQAWEMKPYVEAALEKDYRVEFHEPDTWWKFDPEELEKRNKHGVSREKIIQMLERYEYQISIPIIMNSVLPFHKTSQRPPQQRRQRETVVKKKHKLYKMKQRRKRKRKRKMKGASIKIAEKKPGQQTPSDKDWSQSGDEDSDDKGKFALAIDGYLKELTADGEVDSTNESGLKHSELQKGCFCVSDRVDPVISNKSLQIKVLSGNDCPSSLSLPFVPNKSIAELSSSIYLPDEIQNENSMETKNSILEYKDQSSAPKPDCRNTENSPISSIAEDKAVSALGPGSKLVCNKKEVSVFHQHQTSKAIEKDSWAFFSFDLVNEQPHSSSDKKESCLTWPECAPKVIYEQRPRKARKPKQFFSEWMTDFDEIKSNKMLEKEGDGAVSNEKDDRIDCSLASWLSEMPGIETSDFPTGSVTKDGVSSDVALLASPTGKGRCRRIFNLAPNFDTPRQIPVRKDEKVQRDPDVLTEHNKVSNEDIRGKDKQSLGSHEPPEPSSYSVVVVDSLHPNVDSLLCNSDPTNLKESVDSSKKAVVSPIQMSASASLPSEVQIVAPDKTLQITTDRKREKMSPDISTIQPDILYSAKATTECLRDVVAEKCENRQQIDEVRASKCSQIEDDKDLLSIKTNFLRLPLSQGFALQLVELFGSPAVPLDTLLPEDYVVPLDWTISKEIYLQWKASVEKKQKKNRSEGHDALSTAALQNSDEVDGREQQESSEADPQIKLFQ